MKLERLKPIGRIPENRVSLSWSALNVPGKTQPRLKWFASFSIFLEIDWLSVYPDAVNVLAICAVSLDELVCGVGAVAFLFFVAGFDLGFGQYPLIDLHLVQESEERLPRGADGEFGALDVE